MAITATLTGNIQIAGVSMPLAFSRSNDGGIARDIVLAAGQAGTMSATSNTVTLDSTPVGLATSDTVDVYWDGGLRHGCSVSAIDGNDITLSGGSGDALPAESSAVVLCEATEINYDVDGDDINLIAGYFSGRGFMDIRSDSASLYSREFAAASTWFLDIASLDSNPLTGDPIDSVRVSNGTTAAITVRIASLDDSV